MKRLLTTLILIIGLSFLTACTNGSQNANTPKNNNLSIKNKIAVPQDLNKKGMVIAGQTEVLATREAKKQFNNAKFLEFATPTDCFLALSTGKVNAIAYDRPELEYAAMEHRDLMVLPDNIATGHISVVAALKNKNLITQVNSFIKSYKKDGAYKDMYYRWVYGRNTIMPNIPIPQNPDETIIVGVDIDNVPMSFIQNGNLTGFDIEFAKRLALYLNKKVEFKTISFEGLIPALRAGKN